MNAHDRYRGWASTVSGLSGDTGAASCGRRGALVVAGDRIADRYLLAQRIAAGGMGEVWRATDEMLGRTVAVKLMRSDLGEDVDFGVRFHAEAQAMASLRHAGVARVYDYSAGGHGAAYIVMAYVRGQALSARLANDGRLGHTETMSIVAQAALALHAAHEAGIVHCDVKPGNLLVDADGRVVLVDFGIARFRDAAYDIAAGARVGTARYMAPEQVARDEATPATDVYALGAVAYHCLAGRPPYPGDDPVRVALCRLEEDPPPLPDDVPAAARYVVAVAMARNPLDRFATAADLARAAASAARPTRPARVRATSALTPIRMEALPSSHDGPGPGDRWRAVAAAGIAAVAAVMVSLVFADAGGGAGSTRAYPLLVPPAASADPPVAGLVSELGRQPVVPAPGAPARPDRPVRPPPGGAVVGVADHHAPAPVVTAARTAGGPSSGPAAPPPTDPSQGPTTTPTTQPTTGPSPGPTTGPSPGPTTDPTTPPTTAPTDPPTTAPGDSAGTDPAGTGTPLPPSPADPPAGGTSVDTATVSA
jgi:predicted Ser/Thr protein kinase